jgi:hypothetical protein
MSRPPGDLGTFQSRPLGGASMASSHQPPVSSQKAEPKTIVVDHDPKLKRPFKKDRVHPHELAFMNLGGCPRGSPPYPPNSITGQRCRSKMSFLLVVQKAEWGSPPPQCQK